MARSPIEMMVDKACGYDASKKESLDEKRSKALVAVADAAVKWRKWMKKNKHASAREEELMKAVDELMRLGWK